MADITLRDYLAKLDSLLNSGASSEVIHHCRHILQYFPKNADTYRYLGRALVDTKSWPEAGEVLRRVLSVYPDDFYAHAGLSEVYLNEKRPDDAIWHLERAFEQEPNNAAILDALRELYRKHRRVEHAKVHLTAGAVAQQYMRNGLYGQAITTLQQAIEHAPDRMDLKLLLARTYWDEGQRVDAAETAVEVLKALPDCLEANRILAQLWLGESRPSDAQRYISHIQSVDPYLALELAKGQAVPDDAYKLDELDYRRAAERENATRSPDWLKAVDQSDFASTSSDDSADWMGSLRSRGTAEEEVPSFNQNFSTPAPDDWFSGGSSSAQDLDQPPPTPTPRKRTGLTGLLSTMNAPEEEQKPAPVPEPDAQLETEQPDFADLFGDSAAAEMPAVPVEDAGDLFPADLFPDQDLPPVPEAQGQGALSDIDPLAWMKDTGIEVTGEERGRNAQNTDLFEAGDDNTVLQETGEADPLAWLKGSGSGQILAETDEAEASAMPDDATGNLEAEDPMAWMKGSGVEVTDEASEPAVSTPAASAASGESLDWLSDESLLDEALNLEALTASPDQSSMQRVSGTAGVPVTAEQPDRKDDVTDQNDHDLDWMNEKQPGKQSADDNFTWADDAASDQDLPDLFPNLDASPSPDAAPAADALDWMSDLPDTSQPADADIPNWLNEMKPEEAAPAAASQPVPAAEGDDFDWLSQSNDVSADFPADSGEEVPNWLADMQPADAQPSAPAQPTAQPAASSVDEAGFEWLSQADAPEEDAAAIADQDLPDWLSNMQPSGDEAAAQPEADAEAVAGDTPDWLSEMSPAGDEAAQPAAQIETPDDSGFEWMSAADDAQPEAESEPAAVAGDTPDWLSEMAPVGDEADAQPEPSAVAGDTPDWLSEMAPVGDEADAQPEPSAVAGDTPDWLSEMQPVGDEADAQPEPSAVAGDTPDWLSEMSPAGDEADAQPEPSAVAGDTPDWLSEVSPVGDEADAQPEPAAVAGDTPDWLSEVSPVGDEADAQPEPAAVAGDTPDWLSEMAPVGDEADAQPEPESEPAAVAGDTPDWLSEMSPVGDEVDAQPEPSAVAGDTPDWLSEMAPVGDEADAQPEPAAVAGDTPDWLSAMSPVGDEADAQPEPESEPAMQADIPDEEGGYEWMSEASDDQPTPAEATPGAVPGWLSAMKPSGEVPAQPAASVENAAPEAAEQAVEVGGFNWGGDAADAVASSEVIQPTGAVPDWLATLQANESSEQAESASAAQSETEAPEAQSGTPDWLGNVQETAPAAADMSAESLTPAVDEAPAQWEDESAEEEPAVAGDMPDWLQEVKSARSETPAPAEEAPVSSEYNWIDDITTEGQPVPEDEPVSESSLDDDFATSPDAAMDQEAMPAEAGNAPDWLNAMVPGLDVDFDAPEDEQIESEFLPGSENRALPVFQSASQPTRNREFEWLSNMVDEETQQMKAVEGKPQRGRFTFSHAPAWLRSPVEQSDHPVSEPASNDEDWSDIDLPPWLQ